MIASLIFKSLYENQVLIVDALLKSSKVNVSIATIDQTLQEHPDYPSYLSITDSFKKWNIDCVALQIKADKFAEIPTPFVTNYKNGQFIVVNQILNDDVYILNQHGKKETISKEKFLAQWSETVVVAESNDQSGEPDYKNKQRKAILNTLAIGLIPMAILGAVLIPFINGTVGLVATLYIVAKLVGLTASVLLLWYDIDKGNPLLKQICSGIQKANCSSVLNTKAASLFGILTWSEVGFIYFAFSLLFAAFAGINTVLPLLNLFSLLALPYIVFSIYYQWKIAKQWCVLCLAVQSVLLVEGILTVIDNSISYAAIEQIKINNWSSALVALLMPIAGWFLLKPILKRNQAAKYEKRSYLQLKYNDEVFWTLLQKQASVIEYPSDGLGITIGNPNAKHTIIKVCNPYCGPCKIAHFELEELIMNIKDLKIQIIFTASTRKGDFTANPTKHILAIATEEYNEFTSKCLDFWYTDANTKYSTFANKYPIDSTILDNYNDHIDRMRNWCDKVKIKATPTCFVNGYKLPNNYKISDLVYFFKDN